MSAQCDIQLPPPPEYTCRANPNGFGKVRWVEIMTDKKDVEAPLYVDGNYVGMAMMHSEKGLIITKKREKKVKRLK